MGDRQPLAQGSPRSPPFLPARSTWAPRQGGQRFQPPQLANQWTPGNGGPRFWPQSRKTVTVGDPVVSRSTSDILLLVDSIGARAQLNNSPQV